VDGVGGKRYPPWILLASAGGGEVYLGAADAECETCGMRNHYEQAADSTIGRNSDDLVANRRRRARESESPSAGSERSSQPERLRSATSRSGAKGVGSERLRSRANEFQR